MVVVVQRAIGPRRAVQTDMSQVTAPPCPFPSYMPSTTHMARTREVAASADSNARDEPVA